MDDQDWSIDTLAVRAGTERSHFGEHSDALFLTSSFVFANAAEAAARFANQAPGNVYSRFSNPTVSAFQDRLAALEGGEACIATASGMSAILACCMSALRAGDHVVCSASVFGSTVQLFNNILSRFGIETTYVAAAEPEQWRAALKPSTRLFFVETPSNPLMDLADLGALAAIAKPAGVLLVVDNCFCTPVLQRPLALGADVVVHSATKHLDGQGRVMGGAVVGSKHFIDDQVLPFLRSAGPSLSPFNAWVLLKGLETLPIRMQRHSENALAIARRLEAHPRIARVYHPWLASHPQHALARRQQSAGGAIVSFEVKGADGASDPAALRAAAWAAIDATRLVSITANLGDTRTTITHPATTTHGRITPEARAAAGITEGLIRVAVGLENPDDIYADLVRGLPA